MKRFILLTLAAATIIASAGLLNLDPANAVTAADWKAGRIIDDSVFTNPNEMSVTDIQNFLNNLVPNCDTNGTQPASEYGRPDLTHAQYAAMRGWPGPPYVCLKNYYEVPKYEPGDYIPANNFSGSIPAGAVSAAQIIHDAARLNSLNPKAILVKIATESAGPLTADTWPVQSQYTYAMGSHCPDSGPGGSANCDRNYAGFSMQVASGAGLLRWYMDNMQQSWWSYKKPYQTNSILWNVVETGCGAGDVYIESKATAALYTYTPYQPNQAALNNMYGLGNGCSAYGNRNFWRAWSDWFGSTNITVRASFAERFAELGGASGILGQVTMNQVCNLRNGGCYQGFQNGGIYWSLASGTFESAGTTRLRYMELNTENGPLGYPTSPLICGLKDNGCYQGYQGGSLYYTPTIGRAYENIGGIRKLYTTIGAENGVLGYPASEMICGLSRGGCYQGYEHGSIYHSTRGAYENYGPIRVFYLANGTENGPLGYPTSSPRCDLINDGCYQLFEKGSVYQSTSTGTHSVVGGIYAKWNSLGKEWGTLGYPLTNEIYGLAEGVSYQQFERGYIYWTSRGGVVVLNSIAQRWHELGSEQGKLKYPVSDTNCGLKHDGCYQTFEGGNTIYWTQSTGAKTVWGGIYSTWNSANKEWGALGYPISNEYYTETGTRQDFEHGSIWWRPQMGSTISYQ